MSLWAHCILYGVVAHMYAVSSVRNLHYLHMRTTELYTKPWQTRYTNKEIEASTAMDASNISVLLHSDEQRVLDLERNLAAFHAQLGAGDHPVPRLVVGAPAHLGGVNVPRHLLNW